MKALAKFETIEEANTYVRNRVRKDMLSIGVDDWKFVNEAMRLKKHRYIVIQNSKFDEVGGIDTYGIYRVYLKKSRG